MILCTLTQPLGEPEELSMLDLLNEFLILFTAARVRRDKVIHKLLRDR